jgi:myo-inositol-1(or 4)-monophosphatase
MTLNRDALSTLRRCVRSAAAEELLPRFNAVDTALKADGSIVTEADHAMQDRLQAELAEHYPDYGLLGEEMTESEQLEQLRQSASGIWILDPLDGTSNFAIGIPYFAVSLALVEDGRVSLGVVYDPARDEYFHAVRGDGAWLNGQPLGTHYPATPLARGIAMVDYKRLPATLAKTLAADPPYSSQRSFGSVALDLCWLAAGRAHVYLHGSHNLWDYAAGLAILHEAGGHSVTLDGESDPPLSLQKRSTAAALDEGLFREWCNALGIGAGKFCNESHRKDAKDAEKNKD